MKRNKLTGPSVNRSFAISALIGIGVAALLTGGLSALLSNLVLKGTVDEGQTGIWIFVIRAISVLLGCIVSLWVGKDKNLITLGAVSLGYFVLLVALCIVLFDGAFNNIISGLASVLVGAVAGIVIRLLPARRGKYSAKYRI